MNSDFSRFLVRPASTVANLLFARPATPSLTKVLLPAAVLLFVTTHSGCFLSASRGSTDSPAPAVAPKHNCLAQPNGALTPGSIVRTLIGAVDDVDVEALTVAYEERTKPRIEDDYPEIEQQIRSSVSADVAFRLFSRIGGEAKLDAQAVYDIVARAKDNTLYIADDAQLHSALLRLGESFVVPGAQYFFVKEAIGSRSIEYLGTSSERVDAAVKLDAASFGAAVQLKPRETRSATTSAKELFACVTIEPIDGLVVTKGAGGERGVDYRKREASSADLERFNEAIEDLSGSESQD